MIRCRIKSGGLCIIKASGTAKDMVKETAALIRAIYTKVRQINPEAADGYKDALLLTLLDPKSPVWKEPDHE